MNSYLSAWMFLYLLSCQRVKYSPPPPHYRPPPSPAWLIRKPRTVFSIQIMTGQCAHVPQTRFLLVRFMRPLPPRSCGGPATSEVVTGIPRLIRSIVSLNRRIVVAVPLFPPGSRLPLVPFAGLQQDCSSAGLPFRSCQGFSFFFLFFPANPGSQCGAGGLS